MTEALRRIDNHSDLSPHMLRMMFDEPFFARILRGINIEFGNDIPTAGVMVKDGDVHMLVNPDFISGLSDAEVKGLLKHECFHLAFEHCTSRKLEPHGVAIDHLDHLGLLARRQSGLAGHSLRREQNRQQHERTEDAHEQDRGGFLGSS